MKYETKKKCMKFFFIITSPIGFPMFVIIYWLITDDDYKYVSVQVKNVLFCGQEKYIEQKDVS